MNSYIVHKETLCKTCGKQLLDEGTHIDVSGFIARFDSEAVKMINSVDDYINYAAHIDSQLLANGQIEITRDNVTYVIRKL
ncbi:hypothetical protein H8F18_16485 [Vibrio fluvialis]|uniref:Uncharacterized protein n=1 Tax=Vibrio cholerae TaxID=666 RepID=A0A7Z7VN99_VIBCL|nr:MULTISPECIES: hypothetical protein [Vibrio]MBL4244025.1 hypothetical protein [Vibrio fluvialis]MBL4252941.1 hypothetical protein [Vibrio fluvialis]PNV69623.1 hypothetical protein C1Y48_17315 [Vibrio cholerae]TBM40591.1 hypothetical protein EYB64_14255 [Vibrio cholerae]BEI26102.1 hypothetical protein KKIDH5335_44340 [Vibrio fluvialis]